MMETMLLLVLTLGGGTGGTGDTAASPALAPAGVVAPLTGVWRGTWLPPGGRPMPVEAVLAPGKGAGTLIAVVASGAGQDRRIARMSGRYESDGAHLTLPSGGALRLNVGEGGRLLGAVKGGGAAGLVPDDGALELTRVRR